MTVNISARHWTQVPDEDPGDGLTTVFLQGTDNAYNINISNTYWETFYQYWYVWTVDSNVNQNDVLYTEIYGTFELGGGNDTITANVDQQLYDPDPPQYPYLLGGPGDDIISAGPSSLNAIAAYGGSGNDSITATVFDDLLYGDEIDYFYLWPTVNGFIPAPYSGVDGNDTISGIDGNDTIIGGGGDDVLSGGYGNDSLTASSGSNQIFGGDGADTIIGGSGSDFLYGGPRGTGYLDVLMGGGGADIFMLSYAESANDGGGFWGKYLESEVGTITGGAVKTGLANIFKDGSEAIGTGFLAGAFGAVGQALVTSFLSWIENLGPSEIPAEDVLVVRDFDPSQDVLVLPTAPGVDLSEPAPTAFNPDAAGDYRTGLKFTDNNTSKLYAEVTLSTDFLASVGLTQDDTDDIGRILNFVRSNPTRIKASNADFDSLSNLSAYMGEGGFTPPNGAQLPSGVDVLMFGAIGGLVYHSEANDYANSFIVGTQYADILTINPVIQELGTLTNNAADFATEQSEVHGLGGDDIIYGSLAADILRGGDGNDEIYSFLTDGTGEDLSGGAGNDTLYGGGSFGTFDGGGGTDTFGVFYGQVLAPMQVFIDLIGGVAGERAAPGQTAAPVGPNPPFTPATDNTYTLTGFEGAIGGSLNDWIRGSAGSTIEGGAGADYLLATAGGVTFSYAGSTAGVSVQLLPTIATASGGDAQGDVINYAGASPGGLIGSAQADLLAAGSMTAFSFTGGGGADLFQILSLVPGSTTAQYTITDFSVADDDLIDLRAIGATTANVQLGANFILVTDPGNSSATVRIDLPNFTGTLSQNDLLLAQGVSGVHRADPAGGALSGGQIRDVLAGQGGKDFLAGNAGDDVLVGHGGDDHVNGGNGNDHMRGDAGDDLLFGGYGADTMFGGDGNDRIDAGGGNDIVWGEAGHDTIMAGIGNDLVAAGGGDDVVYGGVGDDSLGGSEGNDTLYGQAGEDQLFGGDGDDLLYGQAGNDLIGGGAGADRIFGGPGSDTIQGAAGRDIINGGAGADVMRGGADADLFSLTFGEIQGDAILDFNAAEGDRLVIRGERAMGVTEVGVGLFSITDGVMAEVIRMNGATIADFNLVVG